MASKDIASGAAARGMRTVKKRAGGFQRPFQKMKTLIRNR